MKRNEKPDEELIERFKKELSYDRTPTSKYARDAAILYNELGKGGHKWGNDRLKILSEDLGMGVKTLQRKIKLAELDDELLLLVDTCAITEEAGYHLAFLDVESQKRVLQVMRKLKLRKIDGDTANRIKKNAKEIQKTPKKCSIDSDKIEEIMKSQSRIRACKEVLRKEKDQ